MNLFSLIVVPYNRLTHLWPEYKRIKKLEATVNTVRIQHSRASEKGMTHYERIYNVVLYLLIFESDFAILKNDALFSIREWKKGYVARQMAVLLYEASKDFPDLLGKDFRASLQQVGVEKDELDRFNKITKAFNEYKNTHRDELKKLRNFVSAHRDNDAALQLKIVEEVELLGVMKLAGDFYDVIRNLIPFLINIVLKLGDWNVIARNI